MCYFLNIWSFVRYFSEHLFDLYIDLYDYSSRIIWKRVHSQHYWMEKFYGIKLQNPAEGKEIFKSINCMAAYIDAHRTK